mgnify:CR=1 FL=1
MNTSKCRTIMVALGILLLVGCNPDSFKETKSPEWTTVRLAPGTSYDKAWATLSDLLSKEFDFELISREDGYLRTDWRYTWTGKETGNYRVRTLVKFPPERDRVEIKAEAQLGGEGNWVNGTDTRLLELVVNGLAPVTVGKALAVPVAPEPAKVPGTADAPKTEAAKTAAPKTLDAAKPAETAKPAEPAQSITTSRQEETAKLLESAEKPAEPPAGKPAVTDPSKTPATPGTEASHDGK